MQLSVASVRPLVGRLMKKWIYLFFRMSPYNSHPFQSRNQCVHFVLNFSKLCSSFRPLIKNFLILWSVDHKNVFKKLNSEVLKTLETSHFDINRLKTDASRSGLGAMREQVDGVDWIMLFLKHFYLVVSFLRHLTEVHGIHIKNYAKDLNVKDDL